MIALKIMDIKDFTNKLFLGEVFDQFWMTEASITTFGIFSIDGRLQSGFFDTDSRTLLEQNGRLYTLWKEVKPYCFSVIRGKRTPLGFKIVFLLSRKKTAAAIAHAGLSISPEEVNGLYLNLQYKNDVLLCTTGTSLQTFIPGKQIDQLWDGLVEDFFRQNQILFARM
jgi:hypothetical protein